MKANKKNKPAKFLAQTRAESWNALHALYEDMDYDEESDGIVVDGHSKRRESKSLLQHTWECFWENSSRLKPGKKYSGKELYGRGLWKFLRGSARVTVLECMDYLVFNGMLPVTHAGDYAERVYLPTFSQAGKPGGK